MHRDVVICACSTIKIICFCVRIKDQQRALFTPEVVLNSANVLFYTLIIIGTAIMAKAKHDQSFGCFKSDVYFFLFVTQCQFCHFFIELHNTLGYTYLGGINRSINDLQILKQLCCNNKKHQCWPRGNISIAEFKELNGPTSSVYL